MQATPSYTEISARTYARESTAPNGSSSGTDYWTIVTLRQDWPVDESLGVYSGLSYRIVERYISSTPVHRGQHVDSSSSPWS